MIWFDGGSDIPKRNEAWKPCITMELIRQLQSGIVVSPRFFSYGGYKTLEGDKNLPKEVQTNWAELYNNCRQWMGFYKSSIEISCLRFKSIDSLYF